MGLRPPFDPDATEAPITDGGSNLPVWMHDRIPPATCTRLCHVQGCISARPETECARIEELPAERAVFSAEAARLPAYGSTRAPLPADEARAAS